MSQDSLLKREVEQHAFPVPSREFILAYLNKRGKSVCQEELLQEFNISNEKQIESLRHRLNAMELDGQLIFNHRYYMLPKRSNLLRGTVIGHRDGYGFLRIDNSRDDYYLSFEQMKMAIHGDIVIAEFQAINRKGRRSARIIRVLIPKINKIVGRVFVSSGKFFVVPDDSRFNFNIHIFPEENYSTQIGFMVVVKLIQRPTRYTKAIGSIIEVLGNTINTKMIVDIALRTHDIPYIWPQAVKEQIIGLQEEVSEIAKFGRIDLRKLPLLTIDGEDAQDFDDAVYCEKKRSGGWQLWVAIADVSYYVRPHTPLDYEAIRRTTSIYFPSQVIPMLPEILSKGLCSLNPQVDRLCMVCQMTISSQGHLSSYKFYEAVMNSHARLTYDNAWKILKGQEDVCANYISLVKPLKDLYEMYRTLERARLKRGSISFETEEIKFIFNNEQRIDHIKSIKRNDAHKLIEECMILTNIAAAYFVEKHKEPMLYRVHDRPTNEQITSLRTSLKESGLILRGGDEPKSKDYSNIMRLIVARPDHVTLQNMILRSMKQAIYDPENRGHFGLALQRYAHFTSPIRRYSDLMLHRSVKYLIYRQKNNFDSLVTPNGGRHCNFEEILLIGKKCSLNERRADEAIRDVNDWLKCDYIQNKIGETFNGIITNITNFGFFVRINNLFVEGLVHISLLDKDYYRYDNVNQKLIGELSGKIYRLGEAVQICVKEVNINERKINFSLISKRKSCNIDEKTFKCKQQNFYSRNIEKSIHFAYKNISNKKNH